MYVYLDKKRVREHENYIDQERNEILRLSDWADTMRNLSEDIVQRQTYHSIYEDLQRLQRSMKLRKELMEDVIGEYNEMTNVISDDIDIMRQALFNLDIKE